LNTHSTGTEVYFRHVGLDVIQTKTFFHKAKAKTYNGKAMNWTFKAKDIKTVLETLQGRGQSSITTSLKIRNERNLFSVSAST